MNNDWKIVFSDHEFEGRLVSVLRHSSGSLRVTTTQKNDESTRAHSDGVTHVFPVVVSVGDKIKFDVNPPEEFEKELQTYADFSPQAAQKIASLVNSLK